MTTIRNLIIGMLVIGLFGLFGFFSGVAVAYEGGSVANGGSISGTVKIAGEVPAVKPLKIDKDEKVCGTSKVNPGLVVDKDKAVKYAVVTLTHIKKGKPLDTKAKVVIDQRTCEFAPHIVVVPIGATLNITNSDPITHNIHTFGFENDPINKAQPSSLPVIPAKFEYPETIKAKCDIHKWMRAVIIATDHPYVAVTDAGGKFKLTDVPPGTYKMEVWHEHKKLKTVKLEVTVKAGADTAVTVDFKPKK